MKKETDLGKIFSELRILDNDVKIYELYLFSYIKGSIGDDKFMIETTKLIKGAREYLVLYIFNNSREKLLDLFTRFMGSKPCFKFYDHDGVIHYEWWNIQKEKVERLEDLNKYFAKEFISDLEELS